MVHLLLFSAGGIRGAIPLADTTRVIRMVRPVEKPGAPAAVAGTINLHGNEISVFSMRYLLGAVVSIPQLTDMLIIARTGSGEVALWVDATSDVQDIPLFPDFARNPDDVLPDIPGVRLTSEGIYVIFDLYRLISCRSQLSDTGNQAASSAVSEMGPGNSGIPPADGDDREISRINTILDERARKIAEPVPGSTETAKIEVLRFRLAYREYAIEMRHIREVILTGKITPVPGTPDYISGICVVRGEIISLVDLRVLLAIPEKGLTDLNRVIVLSDRMLTFGILADHITGIGIIDLDRINTIAPDTTSGSTGYLKGIAPGSLYVLDTDAIFSDPKMIIADA